jgi:Flp pilus assembly CpaF family ATPase
MTPLIHRLQGDIAELNVPTIPFRTEAYARGARMLRTALGPTIASYLEDPAIAEVMLNPDGRLWIDRRRRRSCADELARSHTEHENRRCEPLRPAPYR